MKKNLSGSEALLMNVIWDAGGHISLQELTGVLKEKHGRDYRRTTIATFLSRMSEKGYVRVYHIGRLAFIEALEDADEYKQRVAANDVNLWFKGKPSHFLAAFCRAQDLTDDEKGRIKKIIDGLDD